MSSITSCPVCGAELPTGMTRGLCPKCLMRAGMESGAAQRGPVAANTQAVKPRGFVPPPVEELAERFPQFEILELLGHGGMGAVYKARQKSLDRLVALKIIKPESADDPGFAERFGREARALARLNHPNIVAVYDFGQAEGLFFFVMEFVDGASARQLVADGRLNPAEALAIVPQICEALQFAHDEGVVHRDIKPENILLDAKGRVKIADFGLAKLLNVTENDFTLTGTHQIVGTPRYMAPEQMEGSHEVDHRADIYSLGVVFYEMLTGELPMGHFQPPSKKVQVDVRLDEVVLRTLEKEPDRRYQKASDVKTDVEAVSHLAEAVLAQVEPAQVERAKREPVDVEAARRMVRGPAKWLFITSVVNWIAIPITVALMTVAGGALRRNDIITNDVSDTLPILAIVAFLLCGVMMFGAMKLRQLEAYWLCVVAALLAMIVTPGNLIGLPIGIWALAVLTNRDVRAAFRAVAQGDAATPDEQANRSTQNYVAVGLVLIVPMFALIGFAMWWAGSAWVLAALVMPWFGIGAVATYSDVRQEVVRERAAYWMALFAFLLTLGLIAMGIWQEQSAWPLAAAAVAIGAAILGSGAGYLVANVVEEDEAEEKAGQAVGGEAEEEEEEEEEAEDDDEELDAATAAAEAALGSPRGLMIVVGIVAGLNLFSSGIVTGLMRGAVPEHPPQLLLLLAPIVLLGAWAMFARQFYPMAIIGALACLPVGLSSSSAFMQFAPMGIGLWALVTLMRSEVRAAFGNKAAGGEGEGEGVRAAVESKPQPPRPRGEIAQAWKLWWSERDRTVTRTVQTVLILAHVVCLFSFISMSSSGSWDDDGHRTFTYALGVGNPWFTYDVRPDDDTLFRHNIDFFASSMLAVVIGFALYYVLWRIEKVINPRAGFWCSPQCVAIVWGVLAIGAMGMGMAMGQQAISQTRPGSPAHAQAQAEQETDDVPDVKPSSADDTEEPTVDDDPPEETPEEPPLHQAAAKGDIREANRIIDGGKDTNVTNHVGQTALMKAAAAGHADMSALLVLRTVNELTQDDAGMTALMHAVENDQADVVAMLLKLTRAQHDKEVQTEFDFLGGKFGLRLVSTGYPYRSGVNLQDSKGETALMKACQRGNQRIVEMLLDKTLPGGPANVDIVDDEGRTALMHAAAGGHTSVAELLLTADAKVDAQDKQGRNALMHAIEGGQQRFIQNQREKADAWLRNAFDAVIRFDGCHTLVQPDLLVQTDESGRTPLQIAEELELEETAAGIRDYCQTLIERTTLDIAGGHDYLPVSYQFRGQAFAALGQTEQAAADLRESQRAVAAKNNFPLARSMALQEAARLGQARRVKELLDMGASINDKDSLGRTPLMNAAAGGHGSLCIILMLKGADLTAKDNQGTTALMHAVEKGHAPVVQAYLRVLTAVHNSSSDEGFEKEIRKISGLDLELLDAEDLRYRDFDFTLDALDDAGETAMMKAAALGDLECARLMMEFGSYYRGDLTARDNQGRTALMHAILENQTDFLKALEEDPTYFYDGFSVPRFYDVEELRIADKEGKTALALAEEAGRKEIAELLRRQIDLAIKRYTQLIGMRPAEDSYYLRRAYAYEALGDAEKAQADHEKARR